MYKVLHINDAWEGGGAEAVFRDTVKVSQELGFEHDIFISEGKRRIFSYIFSIAEYKKLKDKIVLFQPDVIHIHNYYHFLSPSILMSVRKLRKKRKWNGRVVFTAHDYHLVCPNSGLQYYKGCKSYNFSINKSDFTFCKKFDRRGYLFSLIKIAQHLLCYKLLKLNNVIDKIISPSYFLKTIFHQWGITCDIHVIRNPIININDTQPRDNEIALNNRLIKIVFMGRVSEEKGVLEFIEKIQNSKLEIEFHIYGVGDLVDFIKKLELRDGFRIIFHGYLNREKLLKEIRKYDIFVLPSTWYENAPLSILEAAHLGLPVVVPDYGGLKEMATLTYAHYTFNHDSENLDNCLLLAKGKVKKNYIIKPEEFTYDYYKCQIMKVYFK